MINGRLYSEVLQEFEQAEDKATRLAVLRKYDHPRFREFLIYALNTKIEFDAEVPNWRPAVEPAGLNYTYLESEIPKLYRFVKNHPQRPEGLTKEKQKQLLVVVLESLHKDEAQILADVITRKFKVNNLTKKLVQEAYPGM
jgi:hypothetical protein